MNILLTLRKYRCRIAFAIALLLLIHSTYLNVRLRTDVQSMSAKYAAAMADVHRFSQSEAKPESIEGCTIPNTNIVNVRGDRLTVYELLKKSSHSIILVEATEACSSCLETSLKSWKKAVGSMPGVERAQFSVLAAGQQRYALQLCLDFGILDSYYSDGTSAVAFGLGLLPSSSIALFANRQGTVIYACFPNWQDPGAFERFLQKIGRYMRAERRGT